MEKRIVLIFDTDRMLPSDSMPTDQQLRGIIRDALYEFCINHHPVRTHIEAAFPNIDVQWRENEIQRVSHRLRVAEVLHAASHEAEVATVEEVAK